MPKSVDPAPREGVDANAGVVDPNPDGAGVEPNREPDVDPNGVPKRAEEGVGPLGVEKRPPPDDAGAGVLNPAGVGCEDGCWNVGVGFDAFS